jgi:hypothetical protein
MSITLHSCSCPHCAQNLEYDNQYSGQEIDCPVCKGRLQLPNVPFEKPRPGLIEGWLEKLRTAKETMQDKAQLRDMLTSAVSDGVLTSDEIYEIKAFLAEAKLEPSVMRDWSAKLFRQAFATVTSTNLSRERLDSLDHIRTFLNLSIEDIAVETAMLVRYRYLLGIREGRLPVHEARNVMLRTDEVAHWVQPAQLWESRVVGRRYEGGSSGVSFRIAKGITIRTGGTRGRSVSESADQIVSEGNFIVTNKRFIFQGDRKSFETKYEKILDVNNHLDGIRYSESNRQKPRQLQYTEPNGDIIVEILSQIFSGRSSD